MDNEILSFPIGKWKSQLIYKDQEIQNWIDDIKNLPSQLTATLEGLGDASYLNKYRPDSWTIRQVIHHIADSHANGYIRHKLTVTETQPRITPYLQSEWAKTEDVKQVPVDVSLQWIQCMHLRWSVFLASLTEKDLIKCYYHPEHDRLISLKESIGMYSWHGRHHTAHIKNAIHHPF